MSDSVEIMVNHLVMLPGARLRTGDWLRRCAPWLDQATADRLVARAIARPIRWNADTLAQRLNLTSEERDRQAKEAKRRAAGARPQALSTSRTKPWIALGISRSKWYADRRAVREREMSGQFRRQYKTGSTVDGIVHTIDGSKAPEVVGSRSDSPACQMSPLGQPLEQGGSPGPVETMHSLAASTFDWRQTSAEIWAEINRLRADILRTLLRAEDDGSVTR
jgi:hypothetical protein